MFKGKFLLIVIVKILKLYKMYHFFRNVDIVNRYYLLYSKFSIVMENFLTLKDLNEIDRKANIRLTISFTLLVNLALNII